MNRAAHPGEAVRDLAATRARGPPTQEQIGETASRYDFEVASRLAQGATSAGRCSRSAAAPDAAALVTQRTVESHVNQIFQKLGLRAASHRRVLALLASLRG